MSGTNKFPVLDEIQLDLRSRDGYTKTVYVQVFDNSLSRKWLTALEHLLSRGYHLEKNYCFLGFPRGDRTGEYILQQINHSIAAINQADLGYEVHDYFCLDNCLQSGPIQQNGRRIVHDKLNLLHRYFEDLQGQSGRMSRYFDRADAVTKWHIRQLNLLCHEFESWALSYRKELEAPAWMRPSQLMCWLNAPRFQLESQDLELFGIDTLNRPLGGVFVGVNKSVGKHHWEVFCDEGRDSRVGELTTSALISQTQAAGDFDIEWANNPGTFPWQIKQIAEFREWLTNNGFDPNDPSLTIGHPQVGQVDLDRSFQSIDYRDIWQQLNIHLDVYQVRTSRCQATYDYRWDDADFVDQQIQIISKGTQHAMAT
jgi:hypothetical protein